MTSTQRIDELFESEQWEAARAALLAELRSNPGDHWLLTRLATTYYEQRKYKEALKYSRSAFSSNPECPLVLWDLAGTLDALGKKDEAIGIYSQLLDRGVQRIANDECGEGEEWARSLLADCKYRIAMACKDIGRIGEFMAFWVAYSVDLLEGVDSIYKDSHPSLIVVSMSTPEKPIAHWPDRHGFAQSFGSGSFITFSSAAYPLTNRGLWIDDPDRVRGVLSRIAQTEEPGQIVVH
jgi:hypothetical protein